MFKESVSVLPLQRDLASATFFDGTAKRQLLLRRCGECKHWNAPEASNCARCRSPELKWAQSTGLGNVIAWAAIHNRSDPDTRSVVGIVELEEGPWMRGRIRTGGREVQTGMSVKTEYAAAEGGESVPVFLAMDDTHTHLGIAKAQS